MDSSPSREDAEHCPKFIIADRQNANINDRLIKRIRRQPRAFSNLRFCSLKYHKPTSQELRIWDLAPQPLIF